MSNLEWALQYYRAGWVIFPCVDKRPHFAALAEHGGSWKWINRATLTEGRVAKWWTDFPEAQIGLVCGQVSNVVVLDMDWLKVSGGGEVDLIRGKEPMLLAERFPKTVMSITGGKGRHLFYRYQPLKNSVKTVHPQIDIRADGGYVILPPSTHQSGNSYAWDPEFYWSPERIQSLPDLPDELLINTGSKEPRERSEWLGLIQGVSEGARNQTAASLSGLLIARLDPYLAWEFMNMWNERNRPPVPAEELERVFLSILQRHYERRA